MGPPPRSQPKSIALPSSRNRDKTEDTQPSPKYSLGGGLALMRVIGLEKQDFYDGMDYFSCPSPPIFTSFKWVHPTCPCLLPSVNRDYKFHCPPTSSSYSDRFLPVALYKKLLLLVLISLRNLCFMDDYKW